MAAFVVPSDPDFNVNHVEQIKQSDYVIAEFVNGYYQNFLNNDKALMNSIQNVEKETNEKIEKAEVDEVTTDQMNELLALIK